MRISSAFLTLSLLVGAGGFLSAQTAAEDTPPPASPVAESTPVASDQKSDSASSLASPAEGDAVDQATAKKRAADTPKPTGVKADFRRGFETGFKSGRPGEIVRVGGDILLGPDDEAADTIAILGSIVAEGIIRGDTVAVFGDVTLNAGSDGDVVAVLGNVTINGPVRGSVVSVLGSVQLGPEADVHQEVVAVGGSLQRAPGAVVRGEVVQLPFLPGGGFKFDGLRAWVQECLRYGRPLALGENLGWVWMLTLSFFAFYLFLSLLFGRAISRTAESLEQASGMTILTALITLLLTPVLLVLLAFTGIGPFLFIPVLMVATLFGKAAFLTWIGRRITGAKGRELPVLATFVGGLILIGLYLIPFVGFGAQKLASFLGLGMAVYAGLIALRRDPAPVTVGAAAGGTVLPSNAPAAPLPPHLPRMTDDLPPLTTTPPPVPPLRMPTTVATTPVFLLPRAGFWIRTGALILDALLVAVLTKLMGLNGYFLVLFAAYATVLWAIKGSTIGGMICGLKVARLDDRPVDWSVSLVRALAGFVSLVPLGLGFFWIAFDRDRQAWHDKIAGTIVVRPPRGVSLL